MDHCAWGSVCNAGAGLGKFVPDAYGVARWAIYVRPESAIRRPEELTDVPIAVGMRAGSHFNVPYRLEAYLPLERIKTVNVGGFGARLTALLNGDVEATSLLDPQISMADQLGLRRVIGNTFKTLWGLQQAEADLASDPGSCLPFWRTAFPKSSEIRPGTLRALTSVSAFRMHRWSARSSTSCCGPPSAGVSTTICRRARSTSYRCRSAGSTGSACAGVQGADIWLDSPGLISMGLRHGSRDQSPNVGRNFKRQTAFGNVDECAKQALQAFQTVLHGVVVDEQRPRGLGHVSIGCQICLECFG